MKPKRAAIHRMLEQRAPITFIGRLVRDMVDMAPVISHMQQRANAAKVVTAPVDNSSETQFMRKNASFAIHFHRDVVNALSDLASEIYDSTHDVTITREEEGTKRQSKSATSPVLVTELEDSNGEEDLENAKPAFVWDLSLDTLNEMILAADTVGDEQCEGYMQRFNALVEQLYTEVREPVRDEKYNATSRLLCQLAEKTALAMESKMSKAVEAEEGGGDTRAVGDESEEAPESATSEVPATEEQATVSLSVAKEAPTIVHAHVLDMVRNFADMIMYI